MTLLYLVTLEELRGRFGSGFGLSPVVADQIQDHPLVLDSHGRGRRAQAERAAEPGGRGTHGSAHLSAAGTGGGPDWPGSLFL